MRHLSSTARSTMPLFTLLQHHCPAIQQFHAEQNPLACPTSHEIQRFNECDFFPGARVLSKFPSTVATITSSPTIFHLWTLFFETELLSQSLRPTKRLQAGLLATLEG